MCDSQPIRYVVFHTPGPRWKHGIDFREQEDVREHVQHYLKLHEQGKLELGDPFLLRHMGRMMVATKDVSHEELGSFTASDPAVKAGLLKYEIRPCLTAMEHEQINGKED
jgi:hypothetical protein